MTMEPVSIKTKKIEDVIYMDDINKTPIKIERPYRLELQPVLAPNTKWFSGFNDKEIQKKLTGNIIEVGEPEFWNLKELFKRREIKLTIEIERLFNEFDFWLMRSTFSFIPAPDNQLEWARVAVKMEPQFEDIENPITYDMYPRDIYEEKNLFSWTEIPGNDNGRLIDFLKQDFDIAWVKTAKIEKIDDRTIRVYTENNSLSLRLNDEKTKINLIVDDGRTDEFTVIMKKGKLNVYKEKNRIGIGLNLKFIEIIEPKSKIQEIEFSRLVPTITVFGIERPEALWDFTGKAALNLNNVNALYIIIKTPIDSKGIKLSYSFYAQMRKGDKSFQQLHIVKKFQ